MKRRVRMTRDRTKFSSFYNTVKKLKIPITRSKAQKAFLEGESPLDLYTAWRRDLIGRSHR